MDHADAREGAGDQAATARAKASAEEIERRTQELVEFRDAGALSEAEFEDRKARLRWSVGR
jgi:plasmid stabilization system protein ParE